MKNYGRKGSGLRNLFYVWTHEGDESSASDLAMVKSHSRRERERAIKLWTV
jgi:hypothetical protein